MTQESTAKTESAPATVLVFHDNGAVAVKFCVSAFTCRIDLTPSDATEFAHMLLGAAIAGK